MTEKELLKVARRAIIIARKVRDARIAVDEFEKSNLKNAFDSVSKVISAVNNMKGMISRYGVTVPEVLPSTDISDIFRIIISDGDNLMNIFNHMNDNGQED